MKTLTTKKLFAFIVTVMMFSFNTIAQIIKTTFDPGITVTCGGLIPCSDSYLLDLNSDGINDFSLQVGGSAGNVRGCTGVFYANRHISVTPLNTNAVSGLKLALNAVIDANTVWNTTVQDLRRAKPNNNGEGTCFISYSGDWSDVTDGYIELKLIVNNEV